MADLSHRWRTLPTGCREVIDKPLRIAHNPASRGQTPSLIPMETRPP